MNAQLASPLATSGSGRSIGDILVSSGRITADDLKKILARQRQDHIPFGEAAIALRLLTKADINFALSKQFDYAYLTPQDSSLSPSLVAAYTPFSRVGENLRAVRSQLMLRWFNGDAMRKVLAVVSPGAKDGRSFIAANLAIVFAQQGERTLLIDADLRANAPAGQQALFKLPRGNGLSGVLAGRAGLDAIQLVPGLPGLAVLPAGAIPPNPQELLGRPSFGQLLLSLVDQFDVILVDTPNGSHFADAEIIAARTGAAIMVGRVDKSSLPETSLLARRLQEGGVTLVGSVLNDF
jgi:receptor protein-tyrosine kinase